MAIIADDKDWTWVLERPCPDCGLDAGQVDLEAVGARLRANAGEWRALLEHPAAALRPADDRWSALEYACHVRDVFRRFDARLATMLHEDGPTFANWDQDATAIEDRYADQDPAVVLVELGAAAEMIASAFDAVRPDQRDRPGQRSDGAQFTVTSLARYLLHDPVHHVWDVTTAYRRMD